MSYADYPGSLIVPAERRDLTDTVVMITGAGAGIGAATATLLLEAGARVVIADLNPAAVQALAQQWPADQVIAQEMNVRAPADAHAAVDAAIARWGRLDSVICNAGIGAFGSILDYTDDQLSAIVDTNLLGTIWAVRAATRHFKQHGEGDIVIVASVAGLGSASGEESVYAASKYGQVGLAISLDRELRPHGIRVSTIAPAAVNTGFADGAGRTTGDPVKNSYLSPPDIATAIVTVLQQPRRMRTALWTLWSMSENA
jgi:NAD(P)-dependent dehydrogenase (short-subunit alcohol dehydrogenase family)